MGDTGQPPGSGSHDPPSTTGSTSAVTLATTGGAENTMKESYSDKLMCDVKKSERLKRNVLEVNLESDNRGRIQLDHDVVAKLLASLGVDLKTQAEAVQICPGNMKKIFVWLKNGVDIERFCKDECFKVADGIKTGLIKPMDRREVAVKIIGLNLNTPDSLVVDYINKHGKVTNSKVIYEVEKDGPLKDLRNGNRKYLVDFSSGRNMGSYHIIDGAYVTISYLGQKKTCGRCHQTALPCPGNGIAKKCEEKLGPKIQLKEHMRNHWEKIGFVPDNFSLPTGEDDTNDVTNDVEIKENNFFTPPHRKQTPIENDTSRYSGVVIRNLPKDITVEEVTAYLRTKGLPSSVETVKIDNNKKNTAAKVDALENKVCIELIKNIHEQIYNENKVYCRGMVEITVTNHVTASTPEKTVNINKQVTTSSQEKAELKGTNSHELLPPTINNPKPSKIPASRGSNTAGAKPKIPGLPESEVKKLKKQKQKTPKKTSKNPASDVIHTTEIDDESGSVSDADTTQTPKSKSKFFTRSPNDDFDMGNQKFKSVGAKQIQKEELWKKNISNQSSPALKSVKRPPSSPDAELRNLRPKSQGELYPVFYQ